MAFSSADKLLNSLVSTIIVVDDLDAIRYVNAAGEQMLSGSSQHLEGQSLGEFIPADNPIFALLRQARQQRMAVSEYRVVLDTPRIGKHYVNVHASPVVDEGKLICLVLHERSIADQIDRQLTHRGAARSVTAMAAMLAHEVKNPLSGIRGAAQLLEDGLSDDDKALTKLIRDETDRIVSLVDRVAAFSDTGHLERDSVNIHKVLNRVLQLAQSGFGRHIRFITNFDPSLPPVLGNRDHLVQVFLNLVKNAVEAAPKVGGEVTLSTAYKHGVSFAMGGRNNRVHLPLLISIQDNGEGIPEDIQSFLFDPFVTTKPTGSGLGLAQVAKIIDDHGGVIEFDSEPKRTVFRTMLPMAQTAENK